MTHKTRECLSRPRKQGARWTGKDIQADEVVQDMNGMGWDAKRDRWNGYNAAEYQAVMEEYEELENLKRQKAQADKTAEDGEEGAGDDGAHYEEETDMGRQQSTSTRQLRLREDTAKYLLNLDLDSAKYDPKTRSMVDSGATADNAAALVADEQFMRASGDAAEFEKAQRYAWETQERGGPNKMHMQANPTAAEFTRKKESKEAEERKEKQRKALLEKYGGQEQFHDKRLKAAEVEDDRFVEYDERGLIKGQPKKEEKSMYPEDVLTNNHTSVWGSWWKDFKWGYACCHSTVKNSYCTGEANKRALEDADALRNAQDVELVPNETAEREEQALEKFVPNAVERDDKVAKGEKTSADGSSRKRTLAEMRDGITEEEREDYQRKRMAANDPMAAHLGKDELVR